METEVWVIAVRRRDGKPPGAEKVANARFYLVRTDADEALEALPAALRTSYMVARALITITGDVT